MITENPMTALERRSVSSLALLYSFRMLGLFMVLPLLSLYSEDLPGASPTMIGLALGIYGLSQAVLQIPFGWLSDRVGRKPIIVAGLLIFALGSLVAASADSIYGIVLGRAMQGGGAIAGTIMALLADLTRDEQRTKAMAVVGVSIGGSFAVALVLGPVIATFLGLSGVFYVTAVLAITGVLIVLFLVPTPDAAVSAVHDDAGAIPGLLGRSFRDAALARLNFGVFVLHFILMASFLLVPQLLESTAGLAREQHWQAYLAALFFSVLTMVPIMRTAERGGRPREMFYLGIGLLLLSLVILASSSSGIALYLSLWLFFTAFNYLEATLPSLVSKSVFAGGKGTALGIYSSCQFLGAFAGGAVGGWLLQFGSPLWLFTLCIALAAIWFWQAHPAGALETTKSVLPEGG
ncbi:MAG: MFS transporter [Halioglobus sp.]